jgi:hypothetical protein
MTRRRPGGSATGLRQVAGVSEKKIFGGLTFLTHGRLTVDAYGARLIARIGAAGMGATVAEPVVRPFAMTGRPMREIIVVAADALAAGVGCPLQH